MSPPVRRAAGPALLLALAVAAGCGTKWTPSSWCGDPPELEGQWRLTGEGTRTGCADPRLDGDVSIDTAMQVVVVQDAVEGVQQLRLADPIAGFELTGEMRSDCRVSLRIVETTAEGAITYDLAGNPQGGEDPGIEDGSFTATGPGTCVTTGTFEVSID
jgi:hypothetical protein